LRVKDIDAHAGQRHAGFARHGGWVGGLFQEVDDAPLGVYGGVKITY